MILASTTIPIVKVILINLVLRNQEYYRDVVPQITEYIKRYLIEDYIAQRKRES